MYCYERKIAHSIFIKKFYAADVLCFFAEMRGMGVEVSRES